MSFEQLGKDLDRVFDSDTFNNIFKILEDFGNPPKKVDPEPQKDWRQLVWKNAYNKLEPFRTVQLSKSNVDAVADWLERTARFDHISVERDGIHTDRGRVKWGEWIINEQNQAVVFASQERFDKLYVCD